MHRLAYYRLRKSVHQLFFQKGVSVYPYSGNFNGSFDNFICSFRFVCFFRHGLSFLSVKDFCNDAGDIINQLKAVRRLSELLKKRCQAFYFLEAEMLVETAGGHCFLGHQKDLPDAAADEVFLDQFKKALA